MMSFWNNKSGSQSPFRRGFTLLELLVVMAITAILISLIFAPIVQSFNLTSRARTQVQSQTAARDAMNLVTRALSNAVFVYDNGQTPLNLWVQDKNGDQRYIPSLFTMIEYVAPARQLDQVPGNIPIDPTTGEPIYGPAIPRGQSGFAVPLAPGRALGRIWIGLINNATTAHTPVVNGDQQQNGMPKVPYANRFEDPANSADNRYALFRAEVTAYVPATLFNPNDTSGKFVPDTRLFHLDSKGNIILHDPNFFYDNSPAGDGSAKYAIPGNTVRPVTIASNWRAVASTMMPVDKVDMITVDRDENTNAILYSKNGQSSGDPDAMPTVRPLATFSPAFLQNDPGVPTSLENTANESPNPAPPTYASLETHWAQPFRVLVYRNLNNNGDPLSQSPLDYYEYDAGDPDPTNNGKIIHWQATPGSAPTQITAANGNAGPTINATTGFWDPTTLNNVEYAFTVDPERGLVNFAFPSSVLVNDGTNPLPQRYSPADINANLDPATSPYAKRYLNLSDPLPSTGILAPFNGTTLNSAPAVSPLNAFRVPLGQLEKISIVPGSERVYGPDQRPGPNYGYRTLYTRVSANAGVIGPNEYKINYQDVPNATAVQDQADPRVRVGYIEFDSLPDGDQVNSGIGPHSLPVFKFNPNTGAIDQTMPADPVEVTYDFQLNRSNDVVKIDYLTRSMVNVAVEARLYDPASSRPQLTDMSDKIRVRNLQR